MKLEDYLKNKQKKYLIFDFDETLITLHLPWDKYIKEIRELLRPLNPQYVDNFKGRIVFLMADLMKRYGSKARKIINDYSQDFETRYLKGFTANQELIDFIKKYYEIYDFFLWSSNRKSTIMPILKKCKLMPFFKKIICQDDVQVIKPEIDGFHIIFNPKSSKKSDYLYIGDSVYDESLCHKLNIDFFNVKIK